MIMKKSILAITTGVIMGMFFATPVNAEAPSLSDEQYAVEEITVEISTEEFNTIVAQIPNDKVMAATEGVIGTPTQLINCIIQQNPQYMAVVNTVIN